jgi:hypothetical protein
MIGGNHHAPYLPTAGVVDEPQLLSLYQAQARLCLVPEMPVPGCLNGRQGLITGDTAHCS